MLDGHPDIRAVALDYYGTLVDVGTGVYPPEHVAEILESKVRAEAGPTMPAQGLTLWEVVY